VVLREVADSLNRIKRDADIVCRIGGDEFALLLPNTPKTKAVQIAQTICDILNQGQYQFDDNLFQISGSVGVTEINDGQLAPETYLQQADIALYVAKKRGRNLVHVYTPEDKASEEFKTSVAWVRRLQEAIFDDQLVLHFQPVVHASTQKLAYVEALVRLEIDGELVMPGEFIPALERAEDMMLLDHQVVSKAIYMMNEHKILSKVAINLSAQAFSDDRLLPLVEQKLNQYKVKPEQIIFEVTESSSLTNMKATQTMIKQLMDLGCEFSIDDFGTGFSTFSYLKDLPANCVKIDGSFVQDMLNNPIDLAIVRAICDIAKALGKSTVAEFVEDQQTVMKLQQLGVDYLQGYFISKPMPIYDCEKLSTFLSV
jgi:EAL domain-containing protein (putative c-di-GMP-specific phosphodiesterase class I)